MVRQGMRHMFVVGEEPVICFSCTLLVLVTAISSTIDGAAVPHTDWYILLPLQIPLA